MSILIVLFYVVAILLFVIATSIKKSHENKMKTYTYETEAVVSDMKRLGKYSYPVFEYEYLGRHMQKQSAVGTSPPAYHVGEVIKIRVNPDNPEQYVTTDAKAQKLACGILYIMAIVFFVVTTFTAVAFSKIA